MLGGPLKADLFKIQQRCNPLQTEVTLALRVHTLSVKEITESFGVESVFMRQVGKSFLGATSTSLVWKNPEKKRPNTQDCFVGLRKRSVARHRLNFNGVSQESAVVKPSLTK